MFALSRLLIKPNILSFNEKIDALPRTNRAGVAIRVRNVAKVSPPAIVLERSTHHWDEGAPTSTSLSENLIVRLKTIGTRPKIVVIAVRTTGLNLVSPAK